MTVEPYLRNQIVKNRAETLVTSWGTDPTHHHDIPCDPDMQMYMKHGTYIRQSNSNGHSDGNSSDKNQISMDTQQDNEGVNNPNVPRLEDNTGTNNENMP